MRLRACSCWINKASRGLDGDLADENGYRQVVSVFAKGPGGQHKTGVIKRPPRLKPTRRKPTHVRPHPDHRASSGLGAFPSRCRYAQAGYSTSSPPCGDPASARGARQAAKDAGVTLNWCSLTQDTNIETAVAQVMITAIAGRLRSTCWSITRAQVLCADRAGQ
jgi:hypothetical protein